jgi:hypothetical protein
MWREMSEVGRIGFDGARKEDGELGEAIEDVLIERKGMIGLITRSTQLLPALETWRAVVDDPFFILV